MEDKKIRCHNCKKYKYRNRFYYSRKIIDSSNCRSCYRIIFEELKTI